MLYELQIKANMNKAEKNKLIVGLIDKKGQWYKWYWNSINKLNICAQYKSFDILNLVICTTN